MEPAERHGHADFAGVELLAGLCLELVLDPRPWPRLKLQVLERVVASLEQTARDNVIVLVAFHANLNEPCIVGPDMRSTCREFHLPKLLSAADIVLKLSRLAAES